ncbi:alanine racemase [Erysipelothrix urinaevulpis]|uniref:alanine racemase n=1 Tax=Erysipelothrix urinaevulpis TaxID=2683717 RepID=UPI00135BDC35|nr:alanine racemase [Erysipelothrix urinaevulpis]
MLTRETWAEVSLENLKYNYDTIREVINDKHVLPVVKADAYGHGDYEVAKLFDDNQESPFICVASLDEARGLAAKGITKDILIFSYVNPKLMLEENNSQFIYTIPSIEWYKQTKGKGRFHLEVNTGMNRMGIKNHQEVKEIIAMNGYDIEGIYTHFVVPQWNEQTLQQGHTFRTLLESIDYDFQYIHAGNIDYELFNHFEFFTGVRVGLSLYGYRGGLGLKPVLSMYSKIIYLEKVFKDETVGYSYAYNVEQEAIVGTIPIGYADGFSRLNERIPVYINNKPYPIVGGICMDQSMILCDESIRLYDTVELIGPNRPLSEIADSMDMMIYEVIVLIGPRVKRIYL